MPTTTPVRPLHEPTDLPSGVWKAALKRTFREVRDDDVPTLAAGVAFKIFLSLFPALVAAVAFTALVFDPQQLLDRVRELGQSGLVPSTAMEVVSQPLANVVATKTSAARSLAVAGILGGLWAAGSAAASLIKALNRAWDIEDSRNFLQVRLVAFAITLALFAAIATIIGLVVFGPQLQRLLVPPGLSGGVSRIVIGALQVLATLAVLVLLFAFVYWIGPDRGRPQWEWLTPGSLLGVLGWLALSGAFTFYTQTFGSYNRTYGALAGVAVLLLWLQLSILVILVGAELNAELERSGRRARRPGDARRVDGQADGVSSAGR